MLGIREDAKLSRENKRQRVTSRTFDRGVGAGGMTAAASESASLVIGV